ncbi:MAG: hypothetical protein HYT29_02055 [Parcubacteria group bacterium]|nr:hypothetical protein [Parcubacteria group bacterium]
MRSFFTPSFLLRAGLAFAFAYAAFGLFLNPSAWIGFFPSFLLEVLPQTVLVLGFFAGELALAAWLLSGWRVRAAALFSAISLAGIALFNLSQMDIIFRDIALALAALALARLSR